MNNKQHEALSKLEEALVIATDAGLLDILLDYCKNPDSINDFCDAVQEIIPVEV